ncbi:MAG: hypothetical protein KGP28_10025 [Bdellovibrionales bacterium]|nr:hypothetical protein [Bdellovibrionales bacterium]
MRQLALPVVSIFFACLFTFSTAYGLTDEITSSQAKLNQHYQERAQKQLDQLIPKGKYTVSVNVSLRTQSPEDSASSIRLPLGLNPVPKAELDPELSPGEAFQSSIEKISLTLAISSEITPPIRSFINQSLKSALDLDPDRGDEILFQDLPSELTQLWSMSPTGSAPGFPIESKTLWIASVALFLFLAGTLLIALFLRRISSSLANEARQISSSLKELAVETPNRMSSGPSAGFSGMDSVFSKPGENEALSRKEESLVAAQAAEQENFWNSLEAEALRMFCLDCLAGQQTRKFPTALLNFILPPAKCDELEKLMEYEKSNFPLLEDEVIHPKDVLETFRAGQAEYRRNGRSPTSRIAIRVPMERLKSIVDEEGALVAVLLINALTPIRRSTLTKGLSLDLKMRLSQASRKKVSMVEHKKAEMDLIQVLEKWATTSREEPDSITLSHLSGLLMEATSFEDDEALYHFQKSNPNTPYEGPLLACDVLTSEDFESIEVQVLALATFGYSKESIARISSSLNGKRKDWYASFIEKMTAEKPGFMSPAVKQARQQVAKIIENRRGAGVPGATEKIPA